MDELKEPATAAASVDLLSFCLSPSSTFYLWHSCLGHVSFSHLKSLASTGALGKLQTHDISYCCECKLAKVLALPFNQSSFVSSSPFGLIHSNVWGSSPIPTKDGSQCYVSFIDDHTLYCWDHLMKHRYEFF